MLDIYSNCISRQKVSNGSVLEPSVFQLQLARGCPPQKLEPFLLRLLSCQPARTYTIPSLNEITILKTHSEIYKFEIYLYLVVLDNFY